MPARIPARASEPVAVPGRVLLLEPTDVTPWASDPSPGPTDMSGQPDIEKVGDRMDDRDAE